MRRGLGPRVGREVGTMWRTSRAAWAGVAAALLGGGCTALGPLLDNPVYVRPDPTVQVENPVFIPQGPASYGVVFEKVIDILDDYFEISYTNRYSGEIKTFPKIAPGLEQAWRPGNPDFYERLRATWQTVRNRAEVEIQPAEDGGYFIKVVVFEELEDLPKPTRRTAAAASFQGNTTVERQFEVIDPTVFESNWAPLGQNCALEQLILQRIKQCL